MDVKGYRHARDAEVNLLHPDYKSTTLRAPKRPAVPLTPTLSEVTGPFAALDRIGPVVDDLTRQNGGEALGERIIVTGRVLDDDGRPVPNTLVEVWQANAAGRYVHKKDQHDAPLDPHFTGTGRVMTDGDGRYRFTSIKPGAYPWGNHHNAWRPAHIHFSLFGPAFSTRLITQMYFPGDPLMALDPIYNAVPDQKARERMICRFDIDVTEPVWALGYVFDIVLRGRDQTPFES